MKMDKFQLIKESIPIIEIFNRYSRDAPKLKGNKYYIRSPFNSRDKDPSCVIYTESNTFYCFSTGIGGDSIKLVCSLFGLKPLEGVLKLAEDFNISIEENTISKQKIQTLIVENEALDKMAKNLKLELNLFYHKVTEFYKLFEEIKSVADEVKIDKSSLEYQFILFNYDFLDRYSDIFIFSSTTEQINAFLNFEEIIKKEWKVFLKWLEIIELDKH